MTEFPHIPRIENASEEMFERGTLDITEKVDGANCRIHVTDNGVLVGNRSTIFSSKLDAPSVFEHIYDHLDDHLDKTKAQEYRKEVGPYTIFGEALHKHTIAYDWEETPSFLGFAIYHHDEEQYLSNTTARETIQEVGLTPVNVVDVVSTDDFSLSEYMGIGSKWYDGKAEGVVFRNTESGQWAKWVEAEFAAINPSVELSEEPTVEELVRLLDVRRRTQKEIERFRNEGVELRTLSGHEVVERVFNSLLREEYVDIVQNEEITSLNEFKSAVRDEAHTVLREQRRELGYRAE